MTFPLKAKKPRNHEDLYYGDIVPDKWGKKFRDKARDKYAPVYDIRDGACVKPLKNVEPVEFKLKPGGKPVYCPRPRWKPAEYEVLHDYYGRKLSVDEFCKDRRIVSKPLAESDPLSAWLGVSWLIMYLMFILFLLYKRKPGPLQ